METWAQTELAGSDFGDKRRQQRGVKILEQLGAQPRASLPAAAGTWGETVGLYRFLANAQVEWATLLAGHRQASLARAQGAPRLLCVQDTTFLNYPGQQQKLRGVGRFAHEEHGLMVHATLGVLPNGVPVGCLAAESLLNEKGRSTRQQCKARPITAKHSGRWLRGLQQLNAIAAAQPAGPELIAVADREADLYERFTAPRAESVHWLVRAAHDRRTAGALLWTEVAHAAVLGAKCVDVPAAPGRPARRAWLEVRAVAVQLRPPHRRVGPALEPVQVWAVHARERAGGSAAPIEWLLLSDLPVPDLATALERIEWYTRRWVIERFFYTLKSGCQVEALQLSERARLEHAVALYLIVAWRLLALTLGARAWPDQPVSAWLPAAEWQTAWRMHHRTAPPHRPPPLAEIVRCLACLGGYLDRKHDAPPGPKVLWRGWQQVCAALAYQAALAASASTCV